MRRDQRARRQGQAGTSQPLGASSTSQPDRKGSKLKPQTLEASGQRTGERWLRLCGTRGGQESKHLCSARLGGTGPPNSFTHKSEAPTAQAASGTTLRAGKRPRATVLLEKQPSGLAEARSRPCLNWAPSLRAEVGLSAPRAPGGIRGKEVSKVASPRSADEAQVGRAGC